MNLEVKRSNRISLSELIELLHGEETKLKEKLLLEPENAQDLWATDADLYKALLVLSDELTNPMLAKLLETVTIIPASAAGEKKRPLTMDELEELRRTL